MHRTVAEAGAWEIFMEADWPRAGFNLARAAHAAGLRSYSFFSDQFTTYVGSDAGFDADRSGPLGLRQLATATLKNGSVYLAVLLPRLPRLPGAGTPPNQSGTFAFDVEAEMEAMLGAGAADRGSFVAGHLDYLHQPRYPGLSQLTPSERRRVLLSPSGATEDASLDWQYPGIPGDALGLYAWKVAAIQKMFVEAVDSTRFLSPGLGNRLILFSDHGSRKDLTEENFGQPRYWSVPLATFGVDGRGPEQPISLLDIPELLNLPDPARPGPATPAVEFAGILPAEAQQLAHATFLIDGRVIPDPKIMAGIGKRIKEYRPFSAPGVYFPTPAR
jgi:hypothetical protein